MASIQSVGDTKFNLHLLSILFVGAVIRQTVVTFFMELFNNKPWFTTPWSSIKQMKEAAFIFENSNFSSLSGDVYDGDNIHMMPILCRLFQHCNIFFTWTIFDFITSLMLAYFVSGCIEEAEQVAHTSVDDVKNSPDKKDSISLGQSSNGERVNQKFGRKNAKGCVHDLQETSSSTSKSASKELNESQSTIFSSSNSIFLFTFSCYWLNPLVIGCFAAKSLASLINMMLSVYLFSCYTCYFSLAAIALSAAVLINPYYIVLLAPLLLSSVRTNTIIWPRILITFAVSMAGILALNFWMVKSPMRLLENTTFFFFIVPDFTPNVGIFWYFFAEVFEHYRLLFLIVFQINAFIYVVPLSALLRKNWVLLSLLLFIQVSIFSSYPSYAELSFYLPITLVFAELHESLRYTLFVLVSLLSSIALMPIVFNLWLWHANANYFFAVVLIYNLAQVFLANDLLSAWLRSRVVDEYANGDFAFMEKNYADIQLVGPFL